MDPFESAELARATAEAAAAHVAARRAAEAAVKAFQDVHVLKGKVTAIGLRVDAMRVMRLPLRAPWLALALASAALLAEAIFALTVW